MVLRDDFTVVCDPKCTPSCRTSELFRTVVAHFEQLLTGANTSSASPLPAADLPRADRRATAPLHGVLGSVSVCVRSASEELGPSTNESYSLRVPAGAANASADQVATLTAATIFGARHGLESFFQLLDVRSQGQPLQLRSAPVIIDDEPRFAYRGLMIDSSRHFLPLHHIKHIIATAAQVKLNVIHWHMTDTQSFSTGSATFPELAAKGAFPNGYSGQTGNSPAAGIAPLFFSPSQMREVVQFAKEHGVRVMPEWDVPGHGSWGMAFPELMTTTCPSLFDVRKPAVYKFLRDFLSEMASIFTDQYLFLGKPHRRLGPLSFLRHNNLGQAATRSTSVASKTRRISQPGCGSTV